MTAELRLGRLEHVDAKPWFRASVADVDIVIDFDSSALLKLADGLDRLILPDILEARRDRIGAAALTLFQNGFYSKDPVPRITLTAIDLI